MTKIRLALAVSACLSAAAVVWAQAAAQGQPAPARVSDGVSYATNGQIVRPERYREWVYVSSGLAMTYGPEQPAAATRAQWFDNVFVNPQSYRAFLASGAWPEGTMFVLELRRAVDHASINKGGQTQGDLVAIEASVKDSTRFASTGGWAYVGFGRASALAVSAAANPPTADCYSCHRQNTAVENTFVQFYPTLFDVARQRGTVKSTYDPNRKP